MNGSGDDEGKGPGPTENQFPQLWKSPVVIIAVSILGSIFFLILSAIFDVDKGGVLRRMSEIEFARGLITYLFAVVTIGTAVLLIVHVLTTVNPDDKRFQHGKEILSLLLGIFGAIVGFYFGREATRPPEDVLNVAPLKLSALSVASGASLTVTTVAFGGRPPLRYAIVFGSVEAKPAEAVDSGGWIVRAVVVPDQKIQTQLQVRVKVEDADHHEGEQSAMIDVGPSPPAQK